MKKQPNQGHWTGQKANPYKYLGFVYLITDHTTGRKYVGKKMYYRGKSIPGCKGRVTDRQSDKWRCRCWSDSGWREYTGSSNKLNKHLKECPDNQYTFEIIYQCRSKASLAYVESREMWQRDVLSSKLDNGEWEYFNENIPPVRFRAPVYIQLEEGDMDEERS